MDSCMIDVTGIPGVQPGDRVEIFGDSVPVEAIADTLPMATHMFLQPCSGTNIPETVAYILKHPHWRLSLQTHKLINIP